MNNIEFKLDELNGVVIISPKHFEDNRGVFNKIFEREMYQKNGIPFELTEEYKLVADKGVMRGIHLQSPNPQARLVSVITGAAVVAAVDLRKDSDTLGMSGLYELNGKNNKIIYVPKGFGVGTLTLEDRTILEIKCSGEYFEEYGTGICYNDKDLNIAWPVSSVEKIIISEKDKHLMSFKEFINKQ